MWTLKVASELLLSKSVIASTAVLRVVPVKIVFLLLHIAELNALIETLLG